MTHARGAQGPGARTVTSAVRGIFRDSDVTRAEAMSPHLRGATESKQALNLIASGRVYSIRARR